MSVLIASGPAPYGYTRSVCRQLKLTPCTLESEAKQLLVIHSLVVGPSIDVDHLGVAHDEGVTVAGVDAGVSASDVLENKHHGFAR